MSDLKNILPQTHNGFVVGWRAWLVAANRLRSLVAPYAWPHLRPAIGNIDGLSDGHLCRAIPMGLYATKSLDWLRDELAEHIPGTRYIYGSVALWGDITEHKNGYRASYAYPIAIATREGSLAIDEIALAYGVTACALDDLEPVTNELMEGKLWTLANRSNVTPLSPSPQSDPRAHLLTSQPNIQHAILSSALSQNVLMMASPAPLQNAYPKLVADEASDVKPPSENDGPKVLVTLWCAFVGMIASLWLVRWLVA